MPEDYVSVEEASRLSGLHANTIRRLIRQRRIVGIKDRYRWWVSYRSLISYVHPITGFLLDMPGPKLFLNRQDEDDDP